MRDVVILTRFLTRNIFHPDRIKNMTVDFDNDKPASQIALSQIII